VDTRRRDDASSRRAGNSECNSITADEIRAIILDRIAASSSQAIFLLLKTHKNEASQDPQRSFTERMPDRRAEERDFSAGSGFPVDVPKIFTDLNGKPSDP
jgi:hypothetical protein